MLGVLRGLEGPCSLRSENEKPRDWVSWYPTHSLEKNEWMGHGAFVRRGEGPGLKAWFGGAGSQGPERPLLPPGGTEVGYGALVGRGIPGLLIETWGGRLFWLIRVADWVMIFAREGGRPDPDRESDAELDAGLRRLHLRRRIRHRRIPGVRSREDRVPTVARR